MFYPHFGIDFLQPLRFLNSGDSETIKHAYLFSFRMVNVQNLQQEKIFHRYLVGSHTATVTCCISFLLVDSKYTGKTMSIYGSLLTRT